MIIRRRELIDIAVLGSMGGLLMWTCTPPYWTLMGMIAMVVNTATFLGWCQFIRDGVFTHEPYWMRQHPLLCGYYRHFEGPTTGRWLLQQYFRPKRKRHQAFKAYYERAACILVAAEALSIEDLPLHINPESEENKGSEGLYIDFILWRLERGV